jgi:tRNA G10  N-methylase Trm11
LACGLLEIGKYGNSDTLVDPFCNDGALCIEAGLLGGTDIYGFDPLEYNVRKANLNMRVAGLKLNIGVDYNFSKLQDNSVKIITNIPSNAKNDEINDFFEKAFRIVKKDMIVCSQKEIYAHKGFKVVNERNVEVGKNVYKVLLFEKEYGK